METATLTSFLFMGFALGMAHAFDPDHIAAVSGMSTANGERSMGSSVKFSLQWSAGHGTAMLLVAIAVFAVGTAVPVALSGVAEKMVAFVLMAIGALALWRLWSPRPPHDHSVRVAPPLVGLIHGTAGSAPLLALIPVSQLQQPAVGIFYVLFFSAGVWLAMLGIGGALAQSLRIFQRVNRELVLLIQGMVAAFSLFLGLYLAFQV